MFPRRQESPEVIGFEEIFVVTDEWNLTDNVILLAFGTKRVQKRYCCDLLCAEFRPIFFMLSFTLQADCWRDSFDISALFTVVGRLSSVFCFIRHQRTSVPKESSDRITYIVSSSIAQDSYAHPAYIQRIIVLLYLPRLSVSSYTQHLEYYPYICFRRIPVSTWLLPLANAKP